MSGQNGLMSKVHSRTNLTGSNRMELLLFKLDDSDDIFGINVFKVREVVQGRAHTITRVPQADERVLGIISIRDVALSLIDLPYALGRQPKPCPQPEKRLIIITEYSGSSQAFLIHDVIRIINKSWEEIEEPPQGLAGQSSVVGITRFEDRVIQILDVEGLLADISGLDLNVEDIETISTGVPLSSLPPVVCADDSKVAQKALTDILNKLGVPYRIFPNGKQAWDYIQTAPECPMALVSDLEMPEMDGYTLIRNIREQSRCADIPIIVNSSMSGDFNRSHVEKAGADEFVSKWEGGQLAAWLSGVIDRHVRGASDVV